MEHLATIVAALVGATLGSLGAEWLRNRFQQQSDADRTRREVAQKHLIQLQDALESLYFRLTNVSDWGGLSVMTKPYYELSSIYAIGNVLAQKRRLMLDGIYALLDTQGPAFPGDLESKLEAIEASIGNEWTSSVSFFRYERLALAESLLIWDGVWRTVTYAEFLGLTTESSFEQVLEPARKFFERLDAAQIEQIRTRLLEALEMVVRHTGIRPPAGVATATV
ncbi:MAG TPA: hypothetical protein VJ935_10795 [Acidimicrobiia bacterium]|nr:hypothetical protein [Acidimicrobiia bacterium]